MKHILLIMVVVFSTVACGQRNIDQPDPLKVKINELDTRLKILEQNNPTADEVVDLRTRVNECDSDLYEHKRQIAKIQKDLEELRIILETPEERQERYKKYK